MSDTIYYTVETPEKRLPKWKRTVIRAEDGRLFVPCIYGIDGEACTMMALAYDGSPLLQYKNHPFMLLDWAEKNDPSNRELWEVIRRNVKKADAAA